ncbi:S26 family signal peptidase [Spirillospora sp. NPDC048911]|uniref:S26 family signal peptidase n=1 Tax=Spirillospora sp. NPDC048911 TaxID=3364527 RepID=UPI00370F96EC
MKRRRARTAVGAGLAVAGGLATLWIRRRYLLTTVSGRSMEPALCDADRVLVRRTQRIRTGQIVVVIAPDPPLVHLPPGTFPAEDELATTTVETLPQPGERLLIKRAIAVPGDRVPRERIPALREAPETVVPPASLVVLGDNPGASWDSRDFGFIRPGECVGVVVRKL